MTATRPPQAALPRDDSPARQRAAGELDTTFLVEASAGTGKTRLLVERIVAIVASGRAPLSEIAAITFTEKAAAELKQRLRDHLEDALAGRGGAVLSPSESERFRRALVELPTAAVSTIHAFAAGLLRERPVEARIDPNFRVLDEVRNRALREEAWRAWREEAFAADDPELEGAVRAGITSRRLDEILNVTDPERDALAEFRPAAAPVAARELLERELVPALETFLRELPGILSACHAPETDRAVPAYRALLEEWETLPSRDAARVGRWMFSRALPSPTAGNKQNWSDPAILSGAKAKLATLCALRSRYVETVKHEALAVSLDRLTRFLAEWRDRRRETGLLDFDDLLIEARTLLRDRRDVRAWFQERFRFLLVDEFQDTDPLQAEMVFFLAEARAEALRWDEVRLEPGKLFLVGDPKQSIYRFRRADIEIYERARDVVRAQPGGRGEVLLLTRNFRSAPAVVDWVNAAFSRVIHEEEGERIQPRYTPLVTSERTAELPGEVRVLTPSHAMRAGLGGEKTHAPDVARLEARLVAGSMRALMDAGTEILAPGETAARPLRHADMAVLLPAYTHVLAYQEALDAQRLPYHVLGGRSFYQQIETHAVISLLRAIEHPHDAVAVAAALRSPAFGVDDRELYRAARLGGFDYLSEHASAGGAPSGWQAELFPGQVPADESGLPERVARAYRLLRRFHRERNRRPLGELLSRVLRETRLLEVLFLLPQGEQRVSNVQRMVEAARGLDREGGATLRRFVEEMSEHLDEGAPEAEPAALEEGDDAVRILSIHRAKGLEFPVVFLAGLGSHRSSRGEAAFLVHRARGEYGLRVSKEFRTLGCEELEEHEKRCQEAEDRRLLYVAATRARNRLVITHAKPAKVEGYLAMLEPGLPPVEEWEHGRALQLDISGPDAPARVVVEEEAGHPAPAPARFWRGLPDLGVPPREDSVAAALRRHAEWRDRLALVRERAARRVPVLHPSELRGPDAAGPEDEFLDAAVRGGESAGTGEDRFIAMESAPGRAARVGLAVHEVMARALELDRVALDAFRVAGCRARGLEPSETRRVERLVERGLASPLLARARRARRVHCEVPFARTMDAGMPPGPEGGFVEGRIDLLFQEEEGLVVVDYKTDDVEGASLAARARAYAPALAEYVRSVERITGRPARGWLLFLAAGEEVPLDGLF